MRLNGSWLYVPIDHTCPYHAPDPVSRNRFSIGGVGCPLSVLVSKTGHGSRQIDTLLLLLVSHCSRHLSNQILYRVLGQPRHSAFNVKEASPIIFLQYDNGDRLQQAECGEMGGVYTEGVLRSVIDVVSSLS